VMDFVDTNIHTTLPHHSELRLHFLRKLCTGQNFIKEHFNLTVLQGINYVMESVSTNIHTMSPNRIFCKNYALVNILSGGILNSTFTKESCGGVWKHKYIYAVDTLHSTVTASV
jgi:hypothetical protein